MLGVDFFTGTPAEAVSHISKRGGLVVAPAAPSFIALQDDSDYRCAIADADLAIADSGWAVLFWRLIQREKLTRISGLALFKALLETPDVCIPKNLFFVLPSEKAKARALEFARNSGYPVSSDDCYVAPQYQRSEVRDQRSAVGIEDAKLVGMLESRKPKHIIVGIGGGMQDKLGSYLKHRLSYRPAIYCIGAAPGFVTGDQVMIPMWADRFFVGWVFRLITQPRTLLPRLWNARRLPGMMLRYGKELPAARPRAARGHRTQVTGNRTEDTGHRTQDRDRGQK
jgi:UDP-N-acetyl-D-mannosaminuronic acid transferase (WecB/TagA/CpsF family)